MQNLRNSNPDYCEQEKINNQERIQNIRDSNPDYREQENINNQE